MIPDLISTNDLLAYDEWGIPIGDTKLCLVVLGSRPEPVDIDGITYEMASHHHLIPRLGVITS